MQYLDETGKRNVLFDFPDLYLHRLAGQNLRDEDHTACLSRKAMSTVNEFFNRNRDMITGTEFHGIWPSSAQLLDE